MYDHNNCKLNSKIWKVSPCNGVMVFLIDLTGYFRKVHRDHVVRITTNFLSWKDYQVMKMKLAS